VKIASAVLLFALALAVSSHAAVTHLSPEHRALLSRPDSFRSVDKTWIPDAVLKLCADSNGRLAAPGERWEPTDVISDSSLPRKRLIWASMSAPSEYGYFYILNYERGGRGHSYHVALLQFDNDGNARLLWRATGDKYPNVSAFANALAQNLPNDNPKYVH
jgi:hypothetical protein